MATILIGGVNYELPEMNFLAIERAWPYVVEASESLDPMKGPAAALGVFAAALMEAEDFDPANFNVDPSIQSDTRIHLEVTKFLKKKLKGSELYRVKNTMFEMLKEAGLEVTEGEAIQSLAEALLATPENSSLETAQDTSLSSSLLGAREGLGTL